MTKPVTVKKLLSALPTKQMCESSLTLQEFLTNFWELVQSYQTKDALQVATIHALFDEAAQKGPKPFQNEWLKFENPHLSNTPYQERCNRNQFSSDWSIFK